ncbi:hypothetical protein HNY73_010479 [Argiope bruennichi]|uniref:Uncharacterized protein n=1 Tax=Argiope bruennichi TaxID=94029 RepID=A0A8T0F3K5_ARGBR|nr:hypothetical protein HNY73_010479 [Argiope bruennichi]
MKTNEKVAVFLDCQSHIWCKAKRYRYWSETLKNSSSTSVNESGAVEEAFRGLFHFHHVIERFALSSFIVQFFPADTNLFLFQLKS